MTSSASGPAWRRLLRLWRNDVRADIDSELRFHFETRVDELLQQGHGETEARRLATEEFGDERLVRRELQAIDMRVQRRRDRQEWFGDAWQDLRYAARSLGRSPGFAAAVVLLLALGIGATGTIASLLDAVYFRPPAGVTTPGEIRRLWTVELDPAGKRQAASTSLDYPDARAIIGAAVPAATATYTTTKTARFDGGRGLAEVTASYASASFLPLLGAIPQRGRFFGAEEDRFGTGAAVAVLSDAFWRTHFAADPDVLGRTVRVGLESFTVIGIAPAGFSGVDLEPTDVWVPFSRYPGVTIDGVPWWESRNWSGFQVLARVPASLSDASLAARATAAYQATARHDGSGDSLRSVVPGPILKDRGPIKVTGLFPPLAGVALVVLLITCANVINLFLARTAQRDRELGIRLALGVRRGRLLRLLLAESLLLAVAAGAASVLLVIWSGGMLRQLFVPDMRWATPPLHWRVVVQIGGLALAAGFVIGLIPASRALATQFSGMLRRGERGASRGNSRLRRGLIVAQTAFSVLLLVGAALFVRSLLKVRAIDLGYRADRLATAWVRPATPFVDEQLEARVKALGEEFRALPGVEGVSRTSHQVMEVGGYGIPWYSGGDSMGSRHGFRPTVSVVIPGYLEVMGMRLRQGSDFSPAGRNEVLVNEAMADALWPDGAMGQCLRLQTIDAVCHTVTGVIVQSKRSRVTELPLPQYLLREGDKALELDADNLILRIAPERMDAVLQEIRGRLQREFPDARIRAQSLTQQMEPQYRSWRLGSTLFVLFGLVALVVAALGIYSNISCDIGQRTRELGIRTALGARPPDIRRQLIATAMRPVALGLVIGVALSLAASQALSALLYQVPPGDPLSIIVVVLLLGSAGLLATLRPAWRAAVIDPIQAMRSE